MEYSNSITLKDVLKKKQVFHNNRGMNLENDINLSNQYYLDTKQAFIYKKPTPIGGAKVIYQNGERRIKDAFYKMPSTLDFNGLYKGYYIEFDAKVTTNKTSFPLNNIHPHQLKHIQNIYNHKGIVFLIISINDEYYLLRGKDLLTFINNEKRKSIPYSYIKDKGYILKYNYLKGLDYIDVIDKIIGG